tara:strand:+ start:5 stop:1177 length:1173 start_codon:yes stop_codon:yes gene_type:complete
MNNIGDTIYVNNGLCELGYKKGVLSFDYEHTFPIYNRIYDFTIAMNVDVTSVEPRFFNLDANVFGYMIDNILTESMLSNIDSFFINVRINPLTSNICVNVNNIDTLTFENYIFTSNVIDIHTNIEYFEHKQSTIKISNIRLFQGILRDSYTNYSSNNVFIGSSSGYENKTAYSNVFLGSKSGYSNQSGYHNIYIGDSASSKNSNGSTNITIGNDSCKETTSGHDNIFIGHNSGKAITNSVNNICIGSNVCYWNDHGVNNVIVGKENLNFDKNYIDGFQINYNNEKSLALHPYPITYKIKNTIYNKANTDLYISLPNYEYMVEANTLNISSNIEFKIYFTYEQLYLTGNIQLCSFTQNVETVIYDNNNILKTCVYDPYSCKYLLHFKSYFM